MKYEYEIMDNDMLPFEPGIEIALLGEQVMCRNSRGSGCGGVAWTGPGGKYCLMCAMLMEWTSKCKEWLCA